MVRLNADDPNEARTAQDADAARSAGADPGSKSSKPTVISTGRGGGGNFVRYGDESEEGSKSKSKEEKGDGVLGVLRKVASGNVGSTGDRRDVQSKGEKDVEKGL